MKRDGATKTAIISSERQSSSTIFDKITGTAKTTSKNGQIILGAGCQRIAPQRRCAARTVQRTDNGINAAQIKCPAIQH